MDIQETTEYGEIEVEELTSPSVALACNGTIGTFGTFACLAA
ncbi:hypothetical protein ACFZB9_30890 [Kitasatospora sp. NPDC008050]